MADADLIPPVSNSEIQTWMDCHRRWMLEYYLELGLAERAVSGALPFGSRMHVCLERKYANGEDPLEVYEELHDRAVFDLLQNEARSGYRDEKMRVKLQKERELAHAMLSGYVAWAEEQGIDEGLVFAGAEVVVEVASGTPGVQLRGKLDQQWYREIDGARLYRDFKPQPVSEPVLTPNGWRKIGDLHIGDYVIGEDGTPRHVLDVFDRGVDDVYDIELNDHTVMRGTADHPWWAKDTTSGRWKIVTTQSLKKKRHRLASYVPKTDETDAALPVPPYALGAWIANGERYGLSVCDGALETMRYVAQLIGSSVVAHHGVARGSDAGAARQPIYEVKTNRTYRARCDNMATALDELDLRYKYSSERFIPDVYIYGASYRQRLELLRGLMDCDGNLSTNYSSSYSTSSRRLADDVATLVRSLGGWARSGTRKVPNRVGTKEDGYDTNVYQSSTAIRSDFNPFLHVRHAERWSARRKIVTGRRGTTSVDRIVNRVTYSGREAVRCIRIDGPTSLYVTRDWCVTHNTAANLTDGPAYLPLDEQMKFYLMLELLDALEKSGDEPSEPTTGGLYTMLKKVKRTERATPPFYSQVEVHHNRRALQSMWIRTQKRVEEMVETRQNLDAGGDHRYWAYPRPTRDCKWKCPFLPVCPVADDSSNEVFEQMLDSLYIHRDPHERYRDDEIKK